MAKGENSHTTFCVNIYGLANYLSQSFKLDLLRYDHVKSKFLKIQG